MEWNDAQAYVNWMETTDGEDYSLPTEAQFEYALRGGTTTPYFFGADSTGYNKYGWPQDLIQDGCQTYPVGAKLPNPWGLFDMVGNAWHWCEDWYANDYYGSSPNVDPQGPSQGDYKVNRGGVGLEASSWRSTMRDALPPNENYSNQSFRIIKRIHD